MLRLHTVKGTLELLRGQKANMPLELNVAFREPKTIQCFLDVFHPWISEQDTKVKLQDPKNGYWKADVLGVTGFEVTSKSEETTGLVPVNAPLAAVVRKLTTKDGHDFFRVRLVATTRGVFGSHPGHSQETKSLIEDIPERFKTFPKARWYRDMLSRTRDALLTQQ